VVDGRLQVIDHDQVGTFFEPGANVLLLRGQRQPFQILKAELLDDGIRQSFCSQRWRAFWRVLETIPQEETLLAGAYPSNVGKGGTAGQDANARIGQGGLADSPDTDHCDQPGRFPAGQYGCQVSQLVVYAKEAGWGFDLQPFCNVHFPARAGFDLRSPDDASQVLDGGTLSLEDHVRAEVQAVGSGCRSMPVQESQAEYLRSLTTALLF
jgi:hypothetical protein